MNCAIDSPSAKAPASVIPDPLLILGTFHSQVESQLCALERLVELAERRGDEACDEARRIVCYFESEAVWHQADEDEDFFPLLRRRAAESGRIEVAALLDEIEREHASLEAQWHRLFPQLEAIAFGNGNRLDAEEVARFAWLYRRHMQRESVGILPCAREVLGAEELSSLAARMAARRAA